jgi:type IV pilus assembly protein PilV
MSILQTGLRNPRRARGFSMIEVLIALIILAVGLLGFALLQTMSLRFAQSANYRTQATNLAYDLLDQMRANRFQAAWYEGTSGASFEAGDIDASDCSRPVGEVSIPQSIERWQCQVVQTLGDTANAEVTYTNGIVDVAISWGDQRWDVENPDEETTFALRTRL